MHFEYIISYNCTLYCVKENVTTVYANELGRIIEWKVQKSKKSLMGMVGSRSHKEYNKSNTLLQKKKNVKRYLTPWLSVSQTDCERVRKHCLNIIGHWSKLINTNDK